MRQSGIHEREQTTVGVSTSESALQRREIWKGFVSGLASGLAATFVMTRYQVNATKLIQKLRPSPQQEQSSDQNTPAQIADRIARAITGREMPPEWRGAAGHVVHYGFGMLMGGIYGVLKEVLPPAGKGRGTLYGAVVWAAADELALPASGLARWWPAYPIHVHANALAAHVVYGSALDGIYRGLRPLLDLKWVPTETRTESKTAWFRQPRAHRRTEAKTSTRRFSRFGLEEQKAA